MRHKILLFCLVLSGFTGLAYELLWVRLLALGFGSTTLSFSTVLAVFFGGLALGAWVAGGLAGRLDNPMRFYGYLEVGTGLFGLAIYPVLVHIGSVFALMDPGSGLAGAAARALVAVPLLLGPTFLMGATLPVVTRAMVVDDEEVGFGSAVIYAFNTLGAFLGVYGVTYHLLPELGVFRSTLVTVGVNFAVGALAIVASRNAGGRKATASEIADLADDVPLKIRRTGTALAFLVGFAAICFQVVWVRMMSIFLDGTVYGVGSVLICVLLGIGLGSLVVARSLRRVRDAGLWFGLLQLVTLFSVLAIISNLDLFGYVLRTSVEDLNGPLALHVQLAWVLAFLFIPSLSSGASFPVLVRVVERKAAGAARSVAQLYTANTVGSILGSLLTGFLLIPYAGTVATVLLGLTAVAGVGAVAMAILSDSNRVVRLAGVAIPLAVIGTYSGFDNRAVSQASENSARGVSFSRFKDFLETNEEHTVYFSEGRSATVNIYARGTFRSLTLNGLGQGGRRELPPHHIFESLMVAYVPYAYVEAPQTGLVVGLGAGVTVDALLQLGLPELTVVELEPDVVEGLDYIFPEGQSPLDDPRAKVRIGDARHHLLVQAQRNPGSYDLVTSMPAHPWVASNIFTQEFFELARRNLSDRGVFATWFGLGRMDETAVASLLRAFTGTFEHYIVHFVPNTGALYLVGSKQPLEVDVARTEALHQKPLIRQHRLLDSPLYLARQIVGTGRPEDPELESGVVNTDDSAYVEVQAPRTSSAAVTVRHLLPVPHLRADMVMPPSRRPEIAAALLEELLGTPDGEIPLRPRRAKPVAHARDTFEAMKGVLPNEARTYLEARLLLAEGKGEEARSLFERVEKEPWVHRARSFLPLTYERGSPEAQAAFERAPPSGATWSVWLDRQGARAVDPIRAQIERSGIPKGDRLAALIADATATSTASHRLDRAEVADLGYALTRTPNLPLLRRVEDYLDRRGWDDLQTLLTERRMQLARNEALKLYGSGKTKGAQGDFRAAEEKLSEALSLHPISRGAQRLWLIAAVEVADPQKLARVRERLAFLGWTDAQLDFAIERAEAGRSKEGFEGIEDPDLTPAPTTPGPQTAPPDTAASVGQQTSPE